MNTFEVGDLLACARELLLSQLLPSLPQPLHYQARMIANALAIAGREIERSDACAQAETKALNAVLANALPLQQGRAVLGDNIRQGLYDADGPARQQVLQALRRITGEQLKINNPKAVPDE